MRQYTRIGIFVLFILSLFAVVHYSQGSTTVTATVVDPLGNPYSAGTASAFRSVNIGQNPGQPINTTTNGAGLFTMTVPSPASYVFTICAPPIVLGPRANPTPTTVCFQTAPLFVSGVSVDLSNTISAQSAVIGPRPGGGGGGGGGSITTPGVISDVLIYTSPTVAGDSGVLITSIPFTNTNNVFTANDTFNGQLIIGTTTPGQILVVGAGGNVISSPSLTQSPTTGNVSVLSITGSGELDLVPNTGVGFQTRLLANNDGTFNVFPSGASFTQLALGSTGLVVAATNTTGTAIKFNDQVGGSASIGIAANSGSPNRMNIPTTTGANGQCMITNGANPQQLSWGACGGAGSVSGQASGVIPLATGATTIGAQSHCNDGNTTAGVVTCTEEINSTVAISTGTKPTICAGSTGCLGFTGSNVAATPTAGMASMRADSVTGAFDCSLFNGAETQCNPLLPTTTVSGDLVCWNSNSGKIINDCGVKPSAMIFTGSCKGVVNATPSHYFVLIGLGGNTTGGACGSGALINTTYIGPLTPLACTAKNLYLHAVTAGAAGDGVFTVYKNGTATAITATIGTGTSASDTTHTASFSAGDQIGLANESNNGTPLLADVSASVICQ